MAVIRRRGRTGGTGGSRGTRRSGGARTRTRTIYGTNPVRVLIFIPSGALRERLLIVRGDIFGRTILKVEAVLNPVITFFRAKGGVSYGVNLYSIGIARAALLASGYNLLLIGLGSEEFWVVIIRRNQVRVLA